MRFPKAYAGVKKILLSEIINTIAYALYLFIYLYYFFVDIDADNSDFMALLFGLIDLMFMFISLFSFLLCFIGMIQALKDEHLFKKAIIFSIVGIIASAIFYFAHGMFGNIFSGISTIATLLTTIYIILAFFNLARKLDNNQMERRGKIVILTLTVVLVISFLSSIISIFAPEIEIILSLLSIGLDLFGHLIFITYLASTHKILAQK